MCLYYYVLIMVMRANVNYTKNAKYPYTNSLILVCSLFSKQFFHKYYNVLILNMFIHLEIRVFHISDPEKAVADLRGAREAPNIHQPKLG